MTALTLHAPPTANQRLKDGFGPTLAVSLAVATGLHALLFALWPTMRASSWGAQAATDTHVVQMATTKLPPTPKALPRPASPEISSSVTAEATLPVFDWEKVVELPPPAPAPKNPEAQANDGTWTGPVTVQPSVANPDEMRQALERVYPSILKDAGIGGTVVMLLRIDTQGRVVDAKVDGTSGYKALDDAALKVAPVLRFHPAFNRDQRVSVWVRIPLTFESHGGSRLLLQPALVP